MLRAVKASRDFEDEMQCLLICVLTPLKLSLGRNAFPTMVRPGKTHRKSIETVINEPATKMPR